MTEFLNTITGVSLGALIALNAWSVKTLLELKVVLVGFDGSNGLNSRVAELDKRIALLERGEQ